MPTIKEVAVYTLEELKNEKPDSYKIAKEKTIQHAFNNEFEFNAIDLSESVSGFQKMLESDYGDFDEDEVKSKFKEYENVDLESYDLDITGVFTDEYIVEAIQQKGVSDEISEDNVDSIIQEVSNLAHKIMEEKYVVHIYDDEGALEYSETYELEFLGNGEMIQL